MFRKKSKRTGRRGLSIKVKLLLSLSAIALSILLSSIISLLMFSRMSSYVSDLIAENVRGINLTRSMSDACSDYNMAILNIVGEDNTALEMPAANHEEFFLAYCDSLKTNPLSPEVIPLVDTLVCAYNSYMDHTKDLGNVLLSDFIDTKEWYFNSLQPQYAHLAESLEALSEEMYNVLKTNSETFDRGFYRSIIPSVVSLAAALLLILMLLFFLSVYYVTPIYKMLQGLNSCTEFNTSYSYEFEGDDQLVELNNAIKDIVSENRQLRKRIASIRNENSGSRC